jgi:RNA polymerase sigma-70 factor (ECF subfamily)
MSHSSGIQPGNHRGEFSQVPEPIRGEAAPVLLTLDFCRKGAGLLIQSEFRGVGLSVQKTRSTTPTVCRRSIHSILKRPVLSAPKPENGNGGPPLVLHFPTPQNVRGKCLQFQSFDESYLSRLRSGDLRTQENFSSYFSTLIKIKLGSRLKSPEAIEDVRQETFARFFVALRDGKILQPDRLGSFVNSICNNVLLEHYRASARNTSLDDEEEKNFPALNIDFLGALSAREREKKVRQILDNLSERDRRLLREVFLEERDKDEVCRDFGVDREYLRVLLHRAKQAFKSSYLKHTGENPPDFARA